MKSLLFTHKYLQNIILWFSLLRSVSHSGGRQGSAELIFFARTDRTHCLSERFGRTDPNRRVGRSLHIRTRTLVKHHVKCPHILTGTVWKGTDSIIIAALFTMFTSNIFFTWTFSIVNIALGRCGAFCVASTF